MHSHAERPVFQPLTTTTLWRKRDNHLLLVLQQLWLPKAEKQ
jgi:hypothetical protein